MRGWKNLIAISLISVIFAHGCISTSLWGEKHPSDEFYLVSTPSGWKLALYRYFPEKNAPIRKHPVLICHGISSNKWMIDLEPQHSLAFYLKKLGFQVWMVNLRGTDRGTKPGPFSKFSYDWTFDDYVKEDVLSVINFVLKKTGEEKVHWIGHSMGGMIMYAYAGTYGDEKLQSIIAVGSPVQFHIPTKLWEQVKKNASIVESVEFIPTRPGALFVAPFGLPIDFFEFTIWNGDNLTLHLKRKLLTLAVENISGGVIRQFATFVKTGKFTSADGKIDYLKNMENIKVPILFITGNLDNLAPPHNVLPGFRRVKSSHKKFVVVSEATGFSEDFGHVDLLIGDPAEMDVYPLIAKWLEEYDAQ